MPNPSLSRWSEASGAGICSDRSHGSALPSKLSRAGSTNPGAAFFSPSTARVVSPVQSAPAASPWMPVTAAMVPPFPSPPSAPIGVADAD